MLGSAVCRALKTEGYTNIIGRTSQDVVIDAAALVGGILANANFPYNFLLEHMRIQNNLIQGRHLKEVSILNNN